MLSQSILNQIENELLDSSHKVSVRKIDPFTKEDYNKTHKDVKSLYYICITHPNMSAGLAPSEYCYKYRDIINNVLEKHSKGKMYVVGIVECEQDVEFEIMFNRNRTVSAKAV